MRIFELFTNKLFFSQTIYSMKSICATADAFHRTIKGLFSDLLAPKALITMMADEPQEGLGNIYSDSHMPYFLKRLVPFES